MSEAAGAATAEAPAVEGYVLLWEPDPKFAQPVREALAEVAPKLALIVAANKQDYEKLLAGPVPEIPTTAALKLQILPEEVGLPLKTKGPLLIVSFEHSQALVTKWSNTGVFNLIQKPYDPLLLKQHLRLALAEGHAPSEFNIHNLKTNASIEMLKGVPMEALSEVGFVTRSDREVPEGRVTKFYGKVFEWNHLVSVYARIWQQKPHPLNPAEKSVFMTWFGTSREQLLSIRAKFPKKEELPLAWRKAVPGPQVKLLIIGDPSPAGSELIGTFQRTFPTAKVEAYSDIPDPKNPIPGPLHAVLIHKDFLDRLEGDARFKDVPRIALTGKYPTDEEFRALGGKVIDVETLPTERVAFLKKMSVLLPDLKPEEELTIKSFPWKEMLNVGQPVEITEMNETGLVMRYERALPTGTLRQFVLWQPMEAGLPMLTARCFSTEPDPSKEKTFLNHFVFFGMSDHEIKHVRLWMRDNYILSKQKS